MDASVSVPVPSLGRDLALTGRDETLDLLLREVSRAATGRFRVGLISGSGGVGKTRVIAEVLKRSPEDVIRMSARSFRWGDTTSFGPWVEAIDRHLRGRPEGEVRQVCGPAMDDLAAIIPSVEAAAGRPVGEPNRGRLLDAIAQLLDRLSRETTLLLALDDIHLADSSAWEALRYLSRRLADAPIVILASARTAGLLSRPIIREVLLGLEDDDVLTRVELEPLGRADVATLAHAVLRADPRATSAFVPEPLVQWLMARSLGYPLFVIGLLQALIHEGADFADPRLERTPHKISERVALDLHGLDPMTRQVLEVLAVVNQRCDPSFLAQLTGRSLPDLGTSLDTLTRAQLVVEHSEGGDVRYEIVHPIVEDVIYEEIGTARRGILHGHAAKMMLDSGRLGAAASHYARAGIQDDEEAVDALFLAMEQAGERDLYQEALAVLETLLDVLSPGDARWVRVLDSVTLRSEWVLSHLAEADAGTAIEAMGRVIDVVEDSEDWSAQALARFHLAAFLSFGAARLDEADRVCREAVELFRRAGDVQGELVAINELAWISGCRGDFFGNAEVAQEVLRRALDEDLTHLATVAAGTAGFAHGVLGRFDEARQLFNRALELAREANIGYRVAWARSQSSHYSLALWGDLEEAVTWGEAALSDDPAAPDALAFENLGVSYWLQGHLEKASAMLERSPVRRPILGSRRRAWGSALAARVYAEMGLWARASSNLERAVSTYDDRFFIWSSWSNWAEGVLAWMHGDSATGLEGLNSLADWLEDAGALGYEPLVLADIAEVAADAGDIAACGRAVTRCSEVARQTNAPLAHWLTSLGAARLHLVTGDHDSAVTEATKAATGLKGAGYGLLTAASQEVLGRALASRDRSRAADTLEKAANSFDACGAAWRRDRVVATLNELGSRGRRAAAAVHGPGSLTPREHAVAVLTAKGHTAHGVGERLFIGRRTVETHLANIYAKLGISSKRELIQRAEEFGLSVSVSRSVSGTEFR